jgi:1-deoxyxylulose-5-phosphate synthase
VRSPKWPEETARMQDGFSEAKHKKIIVAHGASVHGLQGLRRFPENKWLDVALMRVNHKGTKMDTMHLRDTDDLGDVNEVSGTIRRVRARGVGMMGMKLIGEGQFTSFEDREAAMKHALSLNAVDTFTIGFKSTAEIDESVQRIERLLKKS